MKIVLYPLLIFGAVLAKCMRPVKVLNPPSKQDLSEKRVIFWDLDHTLYSQKTGVYSDRLVIRYISENIDVDEEEAKRICSKYARKYAGQVIKGLELDFGVDPVEFEAWIDKEANFERALQPDICFIRKLTTYNARNWVITNSGWAHAKRLLNALGLLDHIEAVIYLDYSCKAHEPILKPNKKAFIKAMKYAGISDPRKCYLVDDIKANSEGACEVGWNSVHFCEPFFCLFGGSRLFRRSDTNKCENIPKISSIHDIDSVFPELSL